MIRLILYGIIFCVSTCSVFASGQGAFVYDATYPDGPGTKPVYVSGAHVDEIKQFNDKAAKEHLISTLMIYGSDVEFYCQGPNDCKFSGPDQNVFIYYETVGKASVEKYRAQFNDAEILAIFDGDTKSALLKPLSYQAMGEQLAQLVATSICKDVNVDGIFMDFEPFLQSSPGLIAFIKSIGTLFASKSCQDEKHPNGRRFEVYAPVGKVTDWGKLAAMLGTNGTLSELLYDIQDSCPPKPTALSAYTSSITGSIKTLDEASRTYQFPYSIGRPAVSSFGEFEKLCTYDSALPDDCRLIRDYTKDGVTQLAYVQAIQAVQKAQIKSPYFTKVINWTYIDFVNPCNKAEHYILLPDRITGDVEAYLQQNG